jgi:hypothetical protein
MSPILFPSATQRRRQASLFLDASLSLLSLLPLAYCLTMNNAAGSHRRFQQERNLTSLTVCTNTYIFPRPLSLAHSSPRTHIHSFLLSHLQVSVILSRCPSTSHSLLALQIYVFAPSDIAVTLTADWQGAPQLSMRPPVCHSVELALGRPNDSVSPSHDDQSLSLPLVPNLVGHRDAPFRLLSLCFTYVTVFLVMVSVVTGQMAAPGGAGSCSLDHCCAIDRGSYLICWPQPPTWYYPSATWIFQVQLSAVSVARNGHVYAIRKNDSQIITTDSTCTGFPANGIPGGYYKLSHSCALSVLTHTLYCCQAGITDTLIPPGQAVSTYALTEVAACFSSCASCPPILGCVSFAATPNQVRCLNLFAWSMDYTFPLDVLQLGYFSCGAGDPSPCVLLSDGSVVCGSMSNMPLSDPAGFTAIAASSSNGQSPLCGISQSSGQAVCTMPPLTNARCIYIFGGGNGIYCQTEQGGITLLVLACSFCAGSSWALPKEFAALRGQGPCMLLTDGSVNCLTSGPLVGIPPLLDIAQKGSSSALLAIDAASKHLLIACMDPTGVACSNLRIPPILADLTFVSIDARDTKSCAITTQGAWYCFDMQSSQPAVFASTQSIFLSVAHTPNSGSSDVCAKDMNRTVWCTHDGAVSNTATVVANNVSVLATPYAILGSNALVQVSPPSPYGCHPAPDGRLYSYVMSTDCGGIAQLADMSTPVMLAPGIGVLADQFFQIASVNLPPYPVWTHVYDSRSLFYRSWDTPCGVDISPLSPYWRGSYTAQNNATLPVGVSNCYSMLNSGVFTLRTSLAPVGFYSDGALRIIKQCPAGTFSLSEGATTPLCGGLCAAGYYGGSHYSPVRQCIQPSAVCPAGYYCPRGSGAPIPCPAGTFNTLKGMTSVDVCYLVPPGFWSAPGSSTPTATPCPAGRYGANSGLGNSSCSGVCVAGYWCPAGSTSPVTFACGARSVYCPVNCSQPISVSVGYYSAHSVDGTDSTMTMQLPCSPGTSCDGSGVARVCIAGSYQNSSTASTCIPCDVGTYASQTNMTSCMQCPVGSTTSGNGGVQCSGCSAGTFFATGICKECPVGRVSNASATACVDCAAGYYTATVGQSMCLQCPLGKYSPVGGYSGTACMACTAGRYGAVAGLTSAGCSGICEAGFYCPYGSSSSRELACGARSVYCPANSSAPIEVPPGYETVLPASMSAAAVTRTAIQPCPVGKYCDGSGVATPCPVGTLSTSMGQASCLPCEVGKYRLNGAQCDNCTVGFYSEAGASACLACAPGRSSISGAGCIDCAAGRAQSGGGGACEICSPGRSANSSGTALCASCLPGSYSAAWGSTQCDSCPRGRYAQFVSGSTMCLACESGSFSSNAGASACTDCERGTASNVSGLPTACDACPPGRYARRTGLTSCALCDIGSYTPLLGSVVLSVQISPTKTELCAPSPTAQPIQRCMGRSAQCVHWERQPQGVGDAHFAPQIHSLPLWAQTACHVCQACPVRVD